LDLVLVPLSSHSRRSPDGSNSVESQSAKADGGHLESHSIWTSERCELTGASDDKSQPGTFGACVDVPPPSEAIASVAQSESWELGSDAVCHVTPTHISSDDPSPNVTKCGGALRRIGNSCANSGL
jgi:hypothetical protein